MMRDTRSWKIGAAIALGVLPYALLPLLGAVLSPTGLGMLSFFLYWVCTPLLCAVCPCILSYHGVPAIGAWVFPWAGAFLLPLHGLGLSFGVMGISFFVGVVSGVVGEEWKKRKVREKGRRR